MTSKVYNKQIGGSHYKDMAMQPSEFINKNKLLFAEGNAIKYICRHAHKGEVQDLEKATKLDYTVPFKIIHDGQKDPNSPFQSAEIYLSILEKNFQ